MIKTNLTYEEMQTTISTFLKDCENIRADRHVDYKFHFLDNYNKYGLKGFLINDNEITARLEQIEEKISSDEGYTYSDAKDRLKNALYDGINYRLLLLFWLNREKWTGEHIHTFSNDSSGWSFDSLKGSDYLRSCPRGECACSPGEAEPAIVINFNLDGVNHTLSLPDLTIKGLIRSVIGVPR